MKRKRTTVKIKAPRAATPWLKSSHPRKGFALSSAELPEAAYRVFPSKTAK